jgi:radical SAM superfamily enzyme YgiQ (UPF0313 family)
MKIDLHCNLPYAFWIPNPSIGYLKGYILQNSGLKVRNIYWNVLSDDLLQKYHRLTGDASKYQNEDRMLVHIAKLLYETPEGDFSPDSDKNVTNNRFFPCHELKEFAYDLKTFFDTSIRKRTLYDVNVAGFTMKTYQWLFNYYIIRRLKQYNPDINIVIGGIWSREQAKKLMKMFNEVDFAIWGEGEITFSSLLSQIENQMNYEQIPNLIYRKKNKLIITRRLTIKDLPPIDAYPFSDHSDYFKSIKTHDLDIRIPIWGTRSCWWNRCKFCIFHEDLFYRERSPENIVAEIEYQSQKYGIDTIMFSDNDIGRKDRKSFDLLLKLLILSSNSKRNPYDIRAEISPLRLDRNSIRLMNKIAVKFVAIGFEAFSDSLLSKMNKPQSFAHNIQAYKFAEEQNFGLRELPIIRGIPLETSDDVIESMINLRYLRFLINKYQPNVRNFILYKGAPFYDELQSEEIQAYTYNIEWPDSENLDFVSSREMKELCGFSRGLVHSDLWERFQVVLDQYMSDCFSYRWFEYSDGSSVVEEYGRDVVDVRCRYMLSPLETALLTFCDTVRLFSDVRRHFVDVDEVDLKRVMGPLKEAGLLYFNDDFKHHIISIVSTAYKNTVGC